MDKAEREGRWAELKKRGLESVLAMFGAIAIATFVIWVLANWSR